jgi:hypothetical protein
VSVWLSFLLLYPPLPDDGVEDVNSTQVHQAGVPDDPLASAKPRIREYDTFLHPCIFEGVLSGMMVDRFEVEAGAKFRSLRQRIANEAHAGEVLVVRPRRAHHEPLTPWGQAAGLMPLHLQKNSPLKETRDQGARPDPRHLGPKACEK